MYQLFALHIVFATALGLWTCARSAPIVEASADTMNNSVPCDHSPLPWSDLTKYRGISYCFPCWIRKYWPISIVVITTAWLVRNKFNNGLQNYPGPFLAAYTDLWRFFDVLGRNAQHTQIRLHKEHGDIVRLGPNVLSFADPKSAKDIYALGKGYYKTQFYPVQNAVSRGQRIQSLFSTTNEDYHARFRRCVNSAFAMSTLVRYEPLVDSTTIAFLEQTEKRFADLKRSCDFSRWLQFYAFDVIGEMAWSKRLGFVEKEEDIDGIIAFIAKFLQYAAPIGQMPWLDYVFLDKNPIKMFLDRCGLWKATFPVTKFAQSRSAERSSEVVKEQDLDVDTAPASTKGVDFLTRFKASQCSHPEFMTDHQVLTATISLVFAGSDTTATTLSSVFYYLLKNPRCHAKLLAELDAAAAAGSIPALNENYGLVSWAEAQELPYLDACIQESFRLFPAIGLLLERHVPPEGATISGQRIAPGTIVGCNAWVLHRRKEIFGEDVDLFRPERWLETESNQLKEMKSAMFQFGAGARTCIGRNISTLEVYKLVPSFLRRFDIEFVDPTQDWKTENCWFVRQLDFNVRFQRRETLGV